MLIPRQELQTRALRKSGRELSIIGWDRDGILPTEEVKDGIRFFRIQPSSGKRRRPGPTGNQALISFWGDADRGLRAALRLGRLWTKTLQSVMAHKADIFVCYHYVFLPLAVCAAKIKGSKVVYDISEFNMEHASYWLPKMLRPISPWLRFFLDMLVQQINGVTCVPDRTGLIYKRASQNCRNTAVVLNVPEVEQWVDEALLSELKKKYKTKKVLVYAGALIASKGILEAVKALKSIKKSYPNILLLLIYWSCSYISKFQ